MQKMQKYKYLLKNVGLLIISNFGTKILSFILIPIYTSILSTAEYGMYDYYMTTVSLLTPILTLNIADAVMRFSLDKGCCSADTFSIGMKRVIKGSALFIILVVANVYIKFIPIFVPYAKYLVLLFVGNISYNLLSQFSRGIDKITDVAIAGVINSVTMMGLNIYLLLFAKLGLEGYFIANCASLFVQVLYYIFRLKIWRYIKIRSNNILKNEMYTYSKPLVFSTIAWWINNVSDRYVVTWICGVAANGIYSVAYKIPSLLNVFQSVFNQAWTLSAVKEFGEGDGEFYSEVYKLYNCGMTLVCSGLIMCDKILARILFSKEFYTAWQYAPFLMISVVFGALLGLIGGIFSAAKQSKVLAQTTAIGSVVNIVLNIGLVYFVGPIGAAIATLVSYIVVWAAELEKLKELVILKFDIKRDIISYVFLLIQSVVWFVKLSNKYQYSIQIFIVIIEIILYINDIKLVINKLVNFKEKRR
jgi:O-antigen/teichoic acid export membrane protein